jgi:hypothetical protein
MHLHLVINLSGVLFAAILAFILLSYYEDRRMDYVVMALAGVGLLLMFYAWMSLRRSEGRGGPDIEDEDPGNLSRSANIAGRRMQLDVDQFNSDLGQY